MASSTQTATGRGLGSLIAPASTSHRFNLSIGLSIRNLLNHTNAGPIVGNISDGANNRRLESQIKLTF